jgi:hypothetical protein
MIPQPESPLYRVWYEYGADLVLPQNMPKNDFFFSPSIKLAEGDIYEPDI